MIAMQITISLHVISPVPTCLPVVVKVLFCHGRILFKRCLSGKRKALLRLEIWFRLQVTSSLLL